MDSSTTNDNGDQLVTAARVSIAFLCLYALTFAIVLVAKIRGIVQAKSAGKAFDRYTSNDMHTADRLNANFLEWAPMFLTILWSLAATSNLSPGCVTAAWLYVTLRAFYIALVFIFGIAKDGMHQQLFISTFPAYFCLIYMLSHGIGALYF